MTCRQKKIKVRLVLLPLAQQRPFFFSVLKTIFSPSAMRINPSATDVRTGNEKWVHCLKVLCKSSYATQCTWPVGVEPRKRAPPKRVDSIHIDHPDVRPSTASSSGISEGSTPPTRHHTPPKRESQELDLPPLTLRRHR